MDKAAKRYKYNPYDCEFVSIESITLVRLEVFNNTAACKFYQSNHGTIHEQCCLFSATKHCTAGVYLIISLLLVLLENIMISQLI